MKALLVALIALVPAHDRGRTGVIHDSVDVIEINECLHRPGAQGTLLQVIFWEFNLYKSEYHVVAWRMWKPQQSHPVYDHKAKKYVLIFWDDRDDVIRCVTATSYRASFTEYDPEVQNRDIHHRNHRRRLTKP